MLLVITVIGVPELRGHCFRHESGGLDHCYLAILSAAVFDGPRSRILASSPNLGDIALPASFDSRLGRTGIPSRSMVNGQAYHAFDPRRTVSRPSCKKSRSRYSTLKT